MSVPRLLCVHHVKATLKQEENGNVIDLNNSTLMPKILIKRYGATHFSQTSVGVRSTVSHRTTRSTAAFSMSLHSCCECFTIRTSCRRATEYRPLLWVLL
jgi:hypothetical protein